MPADRAFVPISARYDRRGVPAVEMHTPEAVARGSPVARLERSYPALNRSKGLMTVSVSDTVSYFFVSRDESVSHFGLASSEDPCLAEALG